MMNNSHSFLPPTSSPRRLAVGNPSKQPLQPVPRGRLQQPRLRRSRRPQTPELFDQQHPRTSGPTQRRSRDQTLLSNAYLRPFALAGAHGRVHDAAATARRCLPPAYLLPSSAATSTATAATTTTTAASARGNALRRDGDSEKHAHPRRQRVSVLRGCHWQLQTKRFGPK